MDSRSKIQSEIIDSPDTPEFTLQKESGGTVYTVTGSYDGTEPLNRKMERIMAEKFTEKMEDSE